MPKKKQKRTRKEVQNESIGSRRNSRKYSTEGNKGRKHLQLPSCMTPANKKANPKRRKLNQVQKEAAKGRSKKFQDSKRRKAGEEDSPLSFVNRQ